MYVGMYSTYVVGIGLEADIAILETITSSE